MKKLFRKKPAPPVQSLPEGAIDITGIDKAELLAAFVNNARDMLRLSVSPRSSESVTLRVISKEEATGLIKANISKGENLRFVFAGPTRVHVDLSGTELVPSTYDGLYGSGAAQKIIDKLHAARPKAKTGPKKPNALCRWFNLSHSTHT